MSHTERNDGRLFELYAQYVGEPGSRKDVYGYWLFILGSVVSFLGVVVHLSGPNPPTTASGLFVREVAISLAALGLPVALFGILLLLPVKRRSIQVAGAGVAIGVLAVAWFVTIYPQNWVGATPDYSTAAIGLYTVGVAIVVSVGALAPVATGEKSLFFEQEYEREAEYPEIMVGESMEGGVFSVFRRGQEWHWRLIEQDALAVGTDEFLSRLETEETVEAVKEKIGEAGLLEIKNAAFRLYETEENLWRWLLVREDGSVVADSGDEFESRDTAAESVNDLKEFGPTAGVLDIGGAAFDYYQDGGRWRWRLVDESRAPIAACATTYDDAETAHDAGDAMRAAASGADTLVVEEFGVELFEDDGWQWRVVDADATELAACVAGGRNRRTVESTVYDCLDQIGDAPVLDAGEPAYEVASGDDDEWRWRLVDGSDDILAHATDAASDRQAAETSARRLQNGAVDADVITIQNADVEYYEAADGWRWRLVDESRTVLAESADAYDDADAVAADVADVTAQFAEADLIEFDTAAFQLYETDGEWRWRLIDEDGNVMADSGEEHASREGAASSMTTVKQNAPDADLLEIETAAFELFHDDDGTWNWRLVDEAGRTIARGGHRVGSEDDARAAVDRLVDAAPGAESRQMDRAAFQVYETEDGWQWRFVHPTGDVVAESADTYSTRDEAETVIDEEIREPATAAPLHTVGSVAFHLIERGDGWSWELRDADRTPVATASVEYQSREPVAETVDALRGSADDAPVFALDDATYVLTSDADGWRWRLVESDWTPLARAPSAVENRTAAETVVDRVRTLSVDAGAIEYEDAAFEFYQSDDRWHWRLVDEDANVIAAGTEGYDSRDAAGTALDEIRTEVADASLLEIDTAAFELHESEGNWRWRLIDENGTPLATSLDAYPTRREAREATNAVKSFAPAATTQVAE